MAQTKKSLIFLAFVNVFMWINHFQINFFHSFQSNIDHLHILNETFLFQVISRTSAADGGICPSWPMRLYWEWLQS